jgi:hypothetical protein
VYAFAHDHAERSRRHRLLDAKLVERALEACHVTPLIDDAATPYLADLVDAVGELVAAVFDMDRGVAARNIPAVDVGNAGQGRLHRSIKGKTACAYQPAGREGNREPPSVDCHDIL